MSERSYLALAKRIITYGERRTDRTGTGTKGVFGASLEFDVRDGAVPLLTTKKVAWEKALSELLWMVRGDTSLEGLGAARNLWEPFAGGDGRLGPVYGAQMRGTTGSLSAFDGTGPGGVWAPREDQLADVVKLLRSHPDTRRAVIDLWTVRDLQDMALPPCPFAFQFSRRGQTLQWLDLAVYQRSADLFLGVPFDLFEAAVLQKLVARELGLHPRNLHWMAGDVHVYNDHLPQLMEQVGRTPSKSVPSIEVREDAPRLFSGKLTPACFRLWDYEPQSRIYGKMSV